MVLNEEKKNNNNNKETRKQERKANRIITVHFTVKIAGRSNYNIDLRKLRINKITAETTKRIQMKNLPTLRNDSSFEVQLSISVSKTRAILLFTIKIIDMFELHASMPVMQSADSSDHLAKISHNYT